MCSLLFGFSFAFVLLFLEVGFMVFVFDVSSLFNRFTLAMKAIFSAFSFIFSTYWFLFLPLFVFLVVFFLVKFIIHLCSLNDSEVVEDE